MQDAKAFLTQVYETVRARDVEGVVQLFAEDCVFVDMTQPEPAQGRSAFRAYMEETFAGMPDFRPEQWSFIADGDHVAAELVLAGTHAGQLFGYEPTHKVVRWNASAFYTLNPAHDQVVREVYYYDLASLTTQLANHGS